MIRVVLGATGSAVAMFMWGFIFWGVLAVPNGLVREAPDEAATQAFLRDNDFETGVYSVPMPAEPGDETKEARHVEGPLAMIFVRERGAPSMPPSLLIGGFAHMWIAAFSMGLVLCYIAKSTTFGARVGIVFCTGAIGAFFSNLAYPVWFWHPWPFHVGTLFYDTVAWLLAGLVLGAIVKPTASRPEAN